MKEDEMIRACRTNEKRNAYRILVGKPEGKRPLERPRHGGIIILKWILGWGVMKWIDLIQDRDQFLFL
jgi:hypothetical protein